MDISRQVAVITDGASGFVPATAKVLLGEGAPVDAAIRMAPR